MVLARDSDRPRESQLKPSQGELTLAAVGRSKLAGLSDVLQLSADHRQRARSLFDAVSQSWGDSTIGQQPKWRSDITDDGSPFEFSVSFGESSRSIRFLIESQAKQVGQHSTWEAGLELNSRLSRQGLVDVSRFARIQDLFQPDATATGQFLLWHAAVVPSGAPPVFKIYLNPALHGDANAFAVVEQALLRLGHRESWTFLERRLRAASNRLLYFSLDLHQTDTARVKIYVGTPDSCSALESLAQGSANIQPGDVTTWTEMLTRRKQDFRPRPMIVCLAFVRPGEPPQATLHAPVRCYLPSDADSLACIGEFLGATDLNVLERAVNSVSPGRLDTSSGRITYASIARTTNTTRVTVYLAPRLFSP